MAPARDAQTKREDQLRDPFSGLRFQRLFGVVATDSASPGQVE